MHPWLRAVVQMAAVLPRSLVRSACYAAVVGESSFSNEK